ncbi:hypothetical protein HK100_010324 [Physocladia obscura]|uniref:GST N-terminal domain-containing protein n=1 Tax=Physocladia obscura TaxID=109957 RepID=A0AAD5XH80_9FUNG|nr:hypothetical protein HK100_010324 [Physocladia obscura]
MIHKLFLFNQNYSSWSLRPLILVRKLGLPVTISFFNLGDPILAAEGKKHSTTGFLPALNVDNKYTVTDSLAIAETLAELFPEKGIWPARFEQRAKARSVAAEMHSGFSDLRHAMTCNLRSRYPSQIWPAAVTSDIHRILTIWENARKDVGASNTHDDDGWLFGRFSAADAMYFPVVTRFLTYAVKIDSTEFPLAKIYVDRVLSDNTVREIYKKAEGEDWAIEKYENVYPGKTVERLR